MGGCCCWCVWVCGCAAVGCVLGFYGWERERERAKLRDADADANGSAAAAAPPPLLLSSSLGSPPIIMITIVALWRCVLVSISRRMSGWYSSRRLVECACPKHTRLSSSSSSSTSSSTSSLFLISRTRVGGGGGGGGGGGTGCVGGSVAMRVQRMERSSRVVVVSAQSSCFSPYYIGGERETSCDTPVVGIVQNAPCAAATTTTATATTTDESSYYYCSHLLLVLVLVLVCSYLQMGRCVCVICSSKRAHVFRPSISDGSFANRTA